MSSAITGYRSPFVGSPQSNAFNSHKKLRLDPSAVLDFHAEVADQQSAAAIGMVARGTLVEVGLEAKVHALVEAFSPYVKVEGLNHMLRDVLLAIESSKDSLVDGLTCFNEATQCYILVQDLKITLMIQGWKIKLNTVDGIEKALAGVDFCDKVEELYAAFNGMIVSEKLYEALAHAAFLNEARNCSQVMVGTHRLKISYNKGNILFAFKRELVSLNDQFIGCQLLKKMNFVSQAGLIANALKPIYEVYANDLLAALRWIDGQIPGEGDDTSFQFDIEDTTMNLLRYKGLYYIGYGDFVVSVTEGVLLINPTFFSLDKLDSITQKLVDAFPSEAGLLDKERFKYILNSFPDHLVLLNQKPKIAFDIEDGRLIFKVKGYSVKLRDCELGLNFYALDESGLSLEAAQKEKAEEVFKRYYQSVLGTYNPTADLEGILQRKVVVISPAYIMLVTDKKIGSGALKTVWKVINLVTGKPFAGYWAKFGHASLEEGVRASNSQAYEISLMQSKRPGCIQSICVKEYPLKTVAGAVAKTVVAVFMKMYASDLFELSIKTDFSNEVKLSFARQIAQSLLGLHRENKVYCDLKLEQILVKPSKKEGLYGFKAVLGDLGSIIDSRPDSEGKIHAHTLTPQYLSPEVAALIYKEGSQKTKWIDYKALDVWTFGILLYQLYLNAPFNKEGEEKLGFELGQRLSALFPINYYDLAINYPGIHAIISHMLVPEGDRWTMERVVAELDKPEALDKPVIALSAI